MSTSRNKSIERRDFLKWSATAAVGIDCLRAGQMLTGLLFDSENPATGPSPNYGLPKYDLLIFGTETIYLSLLPRFSIPGFEPANRYQLILEVALTNEVKANGRQQEIQMKDLEKFQGQAGRAQKQYFTLNTEKLDIDAFFSPDFSRKPAVSFSGAIFEGQLEKGGKRIIGKAVATVKRCIYCCQLDGKAYDCKPGAFKEAEKISPIPPKNSPLEYLLFGNEPNYFLAHKITRPPDFDQILFLGSLSITQDYSLARVIRDGVKIVFTQKSNSVSQRIRVGRRTLGEINLGRMVLLRSGKHADHLDIFAIAEQEIYFEEGELRLPPEFATTPIEKEAGFP